MTMQCAVALQGPAHRVAAAAGSTGSSQLAEGMLAAEQQSPVFSCVMGRALIWYKGQAANVYTHNLVSLRVCT
jgi:hypothetical protein